MTRGGMDGKTGDILVLHSAITNPQMSPYARRFGPRSCGRLRSPPPPPPSATHFFIDQSTSKPNVQGIVLAGSADFKAELARSDLFDPRLLKAVIKTVDVSYGGENGFNQAIELSADTLGSVKVSEDEGEDGDSSITHNIITNNPSPRSLRSLTFCSSLAAHEGEEAPPEVL